MKKLLLSALAAMCALACTETTLDTTLGSCDPSFRPMSFSAIQKPDTKAVINGCSILWQEGDAISIFDVSETPSNIEFPLTEGAGTKTATFHSESAKVSETGYYALYPYTSDATLCDDVISGVKVKATQTLSAADMFNDQSSTVMAAYTTDNTIAFKNVCTYIKFTVGDFDNSPLTEVSFISNCGERLAGTFNLSFSDGLPVVGDVTDGSGIVTLKPFQSTFEEGTYYIAVIPQTLSKGFTISFSNSVKKYWLKTNKNVSLNRGAVLDLGLFSSANTWDTSLSALLGSGTAQDPFQVGTAADLRTVYDKVRSTSSEDKIYRSAYYRQTADIAFGGSNGNINCIGDLDNPFEGTYDGGGFRISVGSGCYGGYSYQGVFGVIRDATLENMVVDIDVSDDWKYNLSLTNTVTGGLVTTVLSSETGGNQFRNCTVNGNFTEHMHGRIILGGFVGDLRGAASFLDCTNNAAITANNIDDNTLYDISAGGFIGNVEFHDGDAPLSFDRCRNTGAVTVTCTSGEGYAGGFIGHEDEGMTTDDIALQMDNCVNKGDVTITANNYSHVTQTVYAGGLVGMHDSDGDALNPYVHNSLNTGDIKAVGTDYSYAGGLMGYCYDADTEFRVCANFADVKATANDSDDAYYGGLCGYDDNLNIKYCLIKYGYKICYADDASEYDHCSMQRNITAADMNKLRTDYGFDGAYIMLWKGENKTLDLDF